MPSAGGFGKWNGSRREPETRKRKEGEGMFVFPVEMLISMEGPPTVSIDDFCEMLDCEE